MLLQFGEERAQFLRKAGSTRAAGKQFQFSFMPQQQCAQNHDASFGGQSFWRRDIYFFKNKLSETFKGQDLQSREAGDFSGGEQLSFQLKRRLFRRKQN